MITRGFRIVGALAMLLTAVGIGVFVPTSAGASSPHVTVLTLQGNSYTPHAPRGGTDDYHCTLVNPHLTSDTYIVGTHFFPNSVEVHHAILFDVPPSLAPEAEAADQGGKGWTCFGETALPSQPLTGGTHSFTSATHHFVNRSASWAAPKATNTSFSSAVSDDFGTPWLAAWAPGVPATPEPPGTGVPFAAGSLVVMQVHYNLLRGDKPVRVKLDLSLVPGSTPLKPLNLDLLPAPPDVPCPSNVTGPLCNRSAELANLAQRTGASQVAFVAGLETICGRNPADPPESDSTSCTWPIGGGREILRVAAHMHLTGESMQVVLDPGTPQARTLLNVPDYDFNDQAPYNLKTPVITAPGDSVSVSCTYNPSLDEELPLLRKVPPHFITWGDGSSDEMCLALVLSVAAPPGAQPSTSTAPVQTKQI